MSSSRQSILLVEDDVGLQKQMQWSLSDYQVLVADDAASALTMFRRETPRVVIVDLGLPPLPDDATEGLKLIEAMLSLEPVKIIVASGNQDRQNAVKAIGLGAYDFFAKPIDADLLLLMVNRAFQLLELEDENRKLQRVAQRSPFDGVVANSPQMLDVCTLIERVAPSNVSVLLLGESGTGKELLARALHTLNPRSANKFVAINCAAIPDTLLESELFGYERGAFTGATRQQPGMIEHAHGGTHGTLEARRVETALVDVRREVHGPQITYRDLRVRGIERDFGAQVRAVHDARMLLRRAQIARVLERDPRMPGLVEHREHAAPELQGAQGFEPLDLASLGARLVPLVSYLERGSIGVVQIRHFVRREQRPLAVRLDALHE